LALDQSRRQLVRGLGAADATALVVGTVIGTGVFLKTAIITQLVGKPMLVLAAWVVAGLVSLAGALTYAELGAMLPETGGEYVYLRAAYGDTVAFQFGWMRVIGGATSTAAVASSFAAFFGSLVTTGRPWVVLAGDLGGHAMHWEVGPRQGIALAAIAAVAVINSIGVKAGGRTQTALAAIKVSAVALIIVGVAVASPGRWSHFAESAPFIPSVTAKLAPAAAFGAAVIAAMWAYTGWSYLPLAAGEIRHPERNLPRAIIGGMLLVVVLYIGINTAYLYALSPAEIVTANSTAYPAAPAVATKAIGTFLSEGAGKIVTVIFLISALGTLNGAMLTTTRVPFAMARAGQFFSVFGTLGRRSHVPLFAIATNAVLASILALSGTYDQLTDLIVFTYAIFYALTASGLFVLRRTMADTPRPYRVIGYPWVPLLFVVATVWLVVNMIRTSPIEAGLVLGLLACGVPAYLTFRRRAAKQDVAASATVD
jgi:basic amino acid/polyamine antiporter, APA family